MLDKLTGHLHHRDPSPKCSNFSTSAAEDFPEKPLSPTFKWTNPTENSPGCIGSSVRAKGS